jgi:hypothetical protein
MATNCNSQAPTAAYPWRRGAENLANKTLSVEAPEFIPRWKEQQPATCGTPAIDGNCYMISLGAYSDDSDDDEVVAAVPATTAGESVSNEPNATSGESASFRFRRPWRAAAAEFVPREVDTKTASSSVDASADAKRKSSQEEKPWSKKSGGGVSQGGGSGEKPWAKRSGGSASLTEKTAEVSAPTATSSKQAAAPWKKKPSAVATSPESGSSAVDESPLSVSTLSTSASSQGLDSTSGASTCTDRSGSSTPREQEAAVETRNESAQALDLQALLRWRHASPSERPAAIVTSAAEVEPEALEELAVEAVSSEPAPTVSSSPSRPCREAKTEPAATREEKCPTPLRASGEHQPEPASAKEEKSWRNVEKVSKLKVSEDSWTAKQRARRAASLDSGSMSDEEIVRALKSILNKLTIEKFDSLSKQLINCGIRTSIHLELLIQEVFEKATTQHHFIDMYADLCGLLHAHFSEHRLVDDPKMNFKKILLTCCQTSFEKHLVPPVGLEKLSKEDRVIAEQLYKTRMLGNIRFVGSLLVRKMLASKVMLAIMEELLQDPTPEALESLAALLTVVGPTFDTPDWAHRTMLNAIFTQVDKLTKKSSVSQRVRCLLKDVVEIRNMGWQDRRPKKIEGPKKLDEVASEAGMSSKSADASNDWAVVGGSRLTKMAAVLPNKQTAPAYSPASAGSGKQQMFSQQKVERKSERSFTAPSSGYTLLRSLKTSDQQEPKKEAAAQKETAPFDANACKTEVSATLSELRVSHDVADAVARIAAIAVPLSQQSIEFGDILCRLVEEGAQESRKVGFQLLAGLFLEGHWKAEALAKGLSTFIEETCPEMQCDVPLLPRIVREELHPAFKPLVKGKFLRADQHDSMIASF